jgi:hypothetical protein
MFHIPMDIGVNMHEASIGSAANRHHVQFDFEDENRIRFLNINSS